MASNGNRKPRIPRAEITTAAPLHGPDRVEAFLQEIKAGAAPLTGIVAIPAQIPAPATSRGYTVATVPFLTTPLLSWSKVTTGGSFRHLIELLQDRGGLWLARHALAVVEWTVGPTHEAADPDNPGGDPRPVPWVRVDLSFTGAWTGRFALAGPAAGLSANLWCVAASPVVGVLPEEIVDKALPARPVDQPVAWRAFTTSLDNVLHTTTNPSEAVRRLVVASGWPGANKLVD